jgi:hypothetical protein
MTTTASIGSGAAGLLNVMGEVPAAVRVRPEKAATFGVLSSLSPSPVE